MQDAAPQFTSQSDSIDPARSNALSATLGLGKSFDAGQALPPFFHQIYFWDAQPATSLGRDGHPRVGGLIPDMGLPRRMWAGGRLAFHAPFYAGLEAEKKSLCETATHKSGRSGPLALVTLRHQIFQAGRLCITEWQDLIYRKDPDPGAASLKPPTAPNDETERRDAHFSPTVLFRYSALTLNGHRIHYDLPYAQQTEGYKGLVVHGPLLAQMLLLMAKDCFGPLKGFSFRATAPLMEFEKADLCRKGNSFWVRGPAGKLCMTAEANPRSE